MTRELEQSEVVPPERLNIDAELSVIQGRPIQVRLSVWPDGVLWFRACRPAKQGMAFVVAFHGQLSGPLRAELVGWFEQSLGIVQTGQVDAEALLTVWTAAHPVREQMR